jgi:uncharacterized RDD family membrane protein YckC
LSNLGSALLDITFDPGANASAEALRFQVAQRLVAHRKRRGRAQAQRLVEPVRPQGSFNSPPDERASRIAAVVAERYARSQSYCAYLAVEAERAVQQAQAAAEVAALNAQAMLQAQMNLLDALSRDGFEVDIADAAGDRAELTANRDSEAGSIAHPRTEFQERLLEEFRLWPEADTVRAPRGRASGKASGVSVRQCDEAEGGSSANAAHGTGSHGYAANGLAPNSPDRGASHSSRRREEWNDAEAQALDEEIAFRQSPVFEEPAGPPMPLPANLIEFPRQLVASRKARPRLAEGPLRDGAEAEQSVGQLRIFEVDPAQIDTTPAATHAALSAALPQWTSIWLDAPGAMPAGEELSGAAAAGEREPGSSATPGGRTMHLSHAASIGRRVAAAAIDGAIILGGFLAFTVAFVLTSYRWALRQPRDSHLMPLGLGLRMIVRQAGSQPGELLVAGALTLVCICLLYQALFFSFSGATPGMRCARIALCTFGEENPSRSAMRWRILALLLSACPLGLGFLWAALDEERLTWHDRICRIYQRCY